MESVEQTSFAVRAELVRAVEREAAAGNETAATVKALSRSDVSRLAHWDAAEVIERPDLERLYVQDDELRICVELAASDPALSACLGYVALEKRRPQPSAWLIDADGAVVDVAGERRRALSFYGVSLRASEIGNWTGRPSSLAHSDVSRLRVA